MWLWDRDYSKVMEVEKWRSERGEAISGDCCAYTKGREKAYRKWDFAFWARCWDVCFVWWDAGIKGG